MNIKQIRVFIASPGGLDAERQAAYAEVERVDRTVAAHLDGSLRAYGWERSMSGRGRAQALINQEMETCELFIGIMWESWGSAPALEGPFSSGFEEEWELSVERSKRTGSPAMAMFFKEVTPSQQRDPGPHVQNVLAFKKRLQDGKEFFYKDFHTTNDFAELVRAFLSKHVIELLRGDRGSSEQMPTISPPSQLVVRSGGEHGTGLDARTTANFLNTVATQWLTESGPTAVDVARLRLTATAAGVSGNDAQVIGVHDANLLFSSRSDFDFTFDERQSLLAAGLSAIESENVPVWSWLADFVGDRSERAQLLTIFGEEAERAGAINAMRLLGLPIMPSDAFPAQMPELKWLGENAEPAIKVAALRYFAALGTSADLAMIRREAALGAKETLSLAIHAIISILLRDDGVEAARYVLATPFETIDQETLKRVLSQFSQLGTSELMDGLDHGSGAVRAAALDRLSSRGALERAVLDRAIEDDNALVRIAALRALTRLGETFSLNAAYKRLTKTPRGLGAFSLSVGGADYTGTRQYERFRWERMLTMSVEELQALLDDPQDRDAAFRALAARRGSRQGADLRANLLDGFESYFSRHWPEGIKPERPQNSLLALSYDPEKGKKRDLIHEALEVVLAQRDVADLNLVRELIDRKLVDVGSTVVSYLRVLGDKTDISRLATATRYNWNWFQADYKTNAEEDAARAILKLHGGSLSELMALDLTDYMRAGLIDAAAPQAFAALSDDELLRLMRLNDLTRRAAARKAASCLDRGRIRRLETDYRTREASYFYQVVYWLDLGMAFEPNIARRVLETTR